MTPMTTEPDPAVLRELRTIPGVGKRISHDLWSLGMRSVEDLRGRDPEALYRRLYEIQGVAIDRCMLYVLRCAVYYASESEYERALLDWWSWTDERMAARAASPTISSPRQ